MKNQPFCIRLGFARAGIVTVWRRERSFRTQTIGAGFVALVMFLVRPSPVWVAFVALSIALVLALELLNSALEYLIDHVHPELAVEIGHAKDAAAGAVLIASIAAVVVGGAMLWTVVIQ